MARDKSALQISAEYAAVRALAAVLNGLSRSSAERLSLAALNGVLAMMPKRRAFMLRSLRTAFPEKSLSDCQAIAEASLRNLAKTIALLPRLPAIGRERDWPWVHCHGLEHVERALAGGKGIIAVTEHYGSWEMMAIATARRYSGVAVVYREMDNPKIDAWVAALRGSAGGLMIPRRHLLRQGYRCLAANGILGILVDQNFAAGGVFVPFFGRLAATTPFPCILARRTGAALVPVHNRWIGNELHITWEAPMALSQNPDQETAIAEDTAALTANIEGWIRHDPAQWLWLHNRWKKQPERRS